MTKSAVFGTPNYSRAMYFPFHVPGGRTDWTISAVLFGVVPGLRARRCAAFAGLVALVVMGYGEPATSTIDLFKAGTEGYHTFRIPVLLASKRGTLLAFCEGRRDGIADHGTIFL